MSIFTVVEAGVNAQQQISRQTLTAAVLAFFLGGVIVFMVGFAPLEIVHNAAHDSRHSAGFPCH